MGAYYQNQVISQDADGKEFSFVQEGGLLKFLETQYALNITSSNIVRELSAKTSKDNPAKVYTVCDYDESNKGEFVQYWLGPEDETFSSEGKDCKVVKREVVLDNSRYLTSDYAGKHVTKVEGLFSGFVICKDTKQYLDINKIKNLANIMYDEEELSLISPIALLTRKNKQSMGGGDIPTPHSSVACLENHLEPYLASWYNKDIYWSSERPSEEFTDITINTCCIEASAVGKINISGQEYDISERLLLPVYKHNEELYQKA